jgi:3,4-dihydroxy 2-butanone 4-phosphate synthase/GTP cyclohydrolase II
MARGARTTRTLRSSIAQRAAPLQRANIASARQNIVAHALDTKNAFMYAPGSAHASAEFDSIESALEDIKAGKFVVVLDDEDRENEGDLIIAADKMTTEAMAFMVEYTSGVICISMEGRDLDRLKLPLMVNSSENEECMYTAFTITVDLRDGTSTGISAADRAATIRALADPTKQASNFQRPGHIFPLRYREGGVLVRPGHTEAAVDLSRLAGSYPAGVLCEIVNKSDGSMSRTPELIEFAKQHGLKCITIAELIRYRLQHEQFIKQEATATMPTRYGSFTAHTFTSSLDGSDHLALVHGDVQGQAGVLTRVQSQSPLVDIFGGHSCEASSQLDAAMAAVAQAGQGVLLYTRSHQQQAGSSFKQELEAYAQQQAACGVQQGLSSAFQADMRDMCVAKQMLQALGVSSAVVLAAKAGESQALAAVGVDVAKEVLLGGSSGLGSSSSNGSSEHAAASNGVALSGKQ